MQTRETQNNFPGAKSYWDFREAGPRAQLSEGQGRNPGLNFNPSFFFFCSKAFSRIFLKSISFLPAHFIAPSRQIEGNKNETEFAF